MARRRKGGSWVAGLLAAATLLGVTAVVLSFAVGSASAAGTTVVCSNDGGTPDLQATIDSDLYSTIFIQGRCVGNFHVDGNVTPSLKLVGSEIGWPHLQTLDGNDSGPVLAVVNGASVGIEDLQFTNGNAEFGGGIFITGCSTGVSLLDSIVRRNTAEFGGGIYVDCGALDLTQSHVDQNTGFFGGGIYAEDLAGVSATRTSVDGNETGNGGVGGGIEADDATVVLTNSSVSHNGHPYEGAGIQAYDSSVSLTGSTVAGNQTFGTGSIYGGGGIWMARSSVSLDHSQVTGNASNDYGGGIANYGGTASCLQKKLFCLPTQGLTMTSSSVDHNTAALEGGGIYNYASDGNASAAIGNQSAVSYNTASEDDGGGIVNYGECGRAASLSITASSLFGNQAVNGSGGAIYNSNGGGCGTSSVTVSKSLIGYSGGAANRAQYGGGIFNESDGGAASLVLQQNTRVVRNVATVNGGGLFNCLPASYAILTGSFVDVNLPNNVVSTSSCP